ncbi:hypothetical protein BKI52_43130 [marine bacterium AO1-C]|nr:hypothetical protein BKI52_43130 [marine bacterium AO1-C]
MKNRKKLNYIIFLMSVALIGLIGLQIYWVNISLKVKKERFNQDVHAALENIVKKLEKREAAFVVKNKFFDRSTQKTKGLNYIFSERSKKRELYKGATTAPHPSDDTAYFFDLSRSVKKIDPRDISSVGVRKNEKGESTIYISTQKRLSTRDIKKYVLGQKINVARDTGTMINIKSQMVSLVVDELIDRPKTLQERITRDLLDSLLNIELISRGIDIPYEFNVVGFKDNQANYAFRTKLSEQTENLPHVLAKANYATMLFPNDIRPQNNQLLLNFPNEQSFMLKKMWSVLASAFLFIGIIIFCFIFAVNTILKQKKMSDMTKDFINNMTHEFKTPIATVSLACQAMQDPDIQRLPKQMNRYMGMIQEENNRLGQQVEKVLQIARLDREDFKLNITDVDVHQSIKKAIRNIQIQVEKRGGILNTNLQATTAHIQADEMHLTNMIINLLDNANKYSPESPEITIQTQSNDRGVRVMISDKGQGISKEMINKVFDKFYRVPTGNVHNVKGFGLGLSYVKTMVDAHQGEIQVKSEPSKGSTFTLFFPYLAQSA